jgi:hypothetical protein
MLIIFMAALTLIFFFGSMAKARLTLALWSQST